LKATYETDKKAYEAAVTTSKTDPKTTVPTKPNRPAPPGAYKGPIMALDAQRTAASPAQDAAWFVHADRRDGTTRGIVQILADNTFPTE